MTRELLKETERKGQEEILEKERKMLWEASESPDEELQAGKAVARKAAV